MSIHIIAFHHPDRAFESSCRRLMNEFLPSKGHTVWELEGGAVLKDKEGTAVRALLELITAKVKDNTQDVVLVMDANFGFSDTDAMVAFQIAKFLQEGFLGFPFHYSEEEREEKPAYGSVKLLLIGGGGATPIKCKYFDVEGKNKKYTFNVELGDFALRKQRKALNDLIRPFKAEEKKKKKAQQADSASSEPTELLSVKTVSAGENRSSISTTMVMASIGSPKSKTSPSISSGITMDSRDNSSAPTTQTRSPHSERASRVSPRIFSPSSKAQQYSSKVNPSNGEFGLESPDKKPDDERITFPKVDNFLKKEDKLEKKKPRPGSGSGCCSIQ